MYAYAKLTPKQSKFVDEQIEAGVYSNPSEVIRAAVREIMKVYK